MSGDVPGISPLSSPSPRSCSHCFTLSLDVHVGCVTLLSLALSQLTGRKRWEYEGLDVESIYGWDSLHSQPQAVSRLGREMGLTGIQQTSAELRDLPQRQ